MDVFEDYVKKMHVDGDFGFAQLYEVSSWTAQLVTVVKSGPLKAVGYFRR